MRKVFYNLFVQLRKTLHKKKKIGKNKLALFPIDSTIVTLTIKLLWSQGFNQVKLFSGLNLLTAEPGVIMIHFGQGHDSKYGDKTIESTPENGVGVMDRGFASLERIKNIKTKYNRYFVLRINNNLKL
ncbi:MAG: transposase [Moorea sp. SIO4A1]|nr:transposase [Moorena sp. SIO4A5]NEQ59043.1 transposase [Moorena sp. SIO4A1]